MAGTTASACCTNSTALPGCCDVLPNCTQTCWSKKIVAGLGAFLAGDGLDGSPGTYGDCDLWAPVVRDCMLQNEMGHCLPPEKTSAANHACAPHSRRSESDPGNA